MNKNNVQPTISLLVHTSKGFLVMFLGKLVLLSIGLQQPILIIIAGNFILVRTNIECRNANNSFSFINYIIQLDLHSFNL